MPASAPGWNRRWAGLSAPCGARRAISGAATWRSPSISRRLILSAEAARGRVQQPRAASWPGFTAHSHTLLPATSWPLGTPVAPYSLRRAHCRLMAFWLASRSPARTKDVGQQLCRAEEFGRLIQTWLPAAGARPAAQPSPGPASRADQRFAELRAIEQRKEGLRRAFQVIEHRHVGMQRPVLD